MLLCQSYRVAAEVKKEKGMEFDYQVGTMIELPRAALTANETAEVADFSASAPTI